MAIFAIWFTYLPWSKEIIFVSYGHPMICIPLVDILGILGMDWSMTILQIIAIKLIIIITIINYYYYY